MFDEFDDAKVTVATFMDLGKAFDCLNHDILTAKLQHYGVSFIDTNWIKSYLLDRKHTVGINNHQLSVRPI